MFIIYFRIVSQRSAADLDNSSYICTHVLDYLLSRLLVIFQAYFPVKTSVTDVNACS